MENIHVIDNFLEENELKIINDIIKSKTWEYNHTSNGNLKIEVPFWNTYLNNEKFITEYLKTIIEKHFFKKFEVQRVYCNGQTYGQDGAFHIDTDDPDCYTFCLYINNIKKEDIDLAAGYIYFKFPDLKYKICYEPINNRGIFFPSSYLHRSSSFTRFFKDIRLCVAWKLREIKEK